MPFGDGTGPMGLGPMTGRAAGYCAGYPTPGYMNPIAGRGYWGWQGTAPWGASAGFGGVPYGTVPYGPGGASRFGWGYGPWGRGRGFGRGRGGGRGRGRWFAPYYW